jgi:hypothetical protein
VHQDSGGDENALDNMSTVSDRSTDFMVHINRNKSGEVVESFGRYDSIPNDNSHTVSNDKQRFPGFRRYHHERSINPLAIVCALRKESQRQRMV